VRRGVARRGVQGRGGCGGVSVRALADLPRAGAHDPYGYVADEVGIADVCEDGAGSSAGTGEDVVEVDALDKRSPVHASGPGIMVSDSTS
jgi:hypothetical protein